jgi:hypothetical protein
VNSAALLFGPRPWGTGLPRSQKYPKPARVSGASPMFSGVIIAHRARAVGQPPAAHRWPARGGVLAAGMRKPWGQPQAGPKGWLFTVVVCWRRGGSAVENGGVR